MHGHEIYENNNEDNIEDKVEYCVNIKKEATKEIRVLLAWNGPVIKPWNFFENINRDAYYGIGMLVDIEIELNVNVQYKSSHKFYLVTR